MLLLLAVLPFQEAFFLTYIIEHSANWHIFVSSRKLIIKWRHDKINKILIWIITTNYINKFLKKIFRVLNKISEWRGHCTSTLHICVLNKISIYKGLTTATSIISQYLHNSNTWTRIAIEEQCQYHKQFWIFHQNDFKFGY